MPELQIAFIVCLIRPRFAKSRINRHWSGFIVFWSGRFSKINLEMGAKPLIFRIKIWLKKVEKNFAEYLVREHFWKVADFWKAGKRTFAS